MYVEDCSRSHAMKLRISSLIYCRCNFSEKSPVMCSVATIKEDCAMKLGHKREGVAVACSLATISTCGGEDATGPNEAAERLLCAVTDNDDEASVALRYTRTVRPLIVLGGLRYPRSALLASAPIVLDVNHSRAIRLIRFYTTEILGSVLYPVGYLVISSYVFPLQ